MVKFKPAIWLAFAWLITGIGALIAALFLWAYAFNWPADPSVYNQRDIFRNIAGVLLLYGIFVTPAAFFVVLAPLGHLNKKREEVPKPGST